MLVADLDSYLSHPDKKLVDHINGVLCGVQKRTNSKVAELCAIFHDIGKLNPNFQEKLKTDNSNGYSHHAYLSAYSFLSYYLKNERQLLDILKNENIWLISILMIIASHHKNLPNLPDVLKELELNNLIDFLESQSDIPVSQFLSQLIIHEKFSVYNENFAGIIKDYPIRIGKLTQNALRMGNAVIFFLETQFSFASLIAADKEDAGNYYLNNRDDVFFRSYSPSLNAFIEKLDPSSELNHIRTRIRKESIANILSALKEGKRIFSLTSPTGSGKTVTLLALAGEILKQRGNYRIIYSLPFLSITEQVEQVCEEIFFQNKECIARIDSKSEDKSFLQYQNSLDGNSQNVGNIIGAKFAEETFDYPFIITTFVRLFETFLSNENAALLKLPNFSKSIFLIDEIQSLPPRLYGFFVAFLDSFCAKYDSYAIISTATMPSFTLPNEQENARHDLEKFFVNYNIPPELLSLSYYENKVFNRYVIKNHIGKIEVDGLAKLVLAEKSSSLIIVNTIDDSKRLFDLLYQKDVPITVILLNTHFTPQDRRKKIVAAKRCLEDEEKVILISTQLIEAGVDIDFPVVFRDIAPLPSIIQSAGRCNRNGKGEKRGRVFLYELLQNNQSRAELIYNNKDKNLLEKTREILQNFEYSEGELIGSQYEYFKYINKNLLFGVHDDIDIVKCIKEGAFETLGKFRLISEKEYGESKQYYISQNTRDDNFEILIRLREELKLIRHNEFSSRKLKLIEIENHLKRMSESIVQVRLKPSDSKPIADCEECFNISKLSQDYDSVYGVHLSSENQII
jgi:CRISPR-associated endonuclease/helicase Cas3